jgi:hypothetical protein
LVACALSNMAGQGDKLQVSSVLHMHCA